MARHGGPSRDDAASPVTAPPPAVEVRAGPGVPVCTPVECGAVGAGVGDAGAGPREEVSMGAAAGDAGAGGVGVPAPMRRH